MSQDKDRELMHRILDGDASPEERRLFHEKTGSDPKLQREFDALSASVRVLEKAERKIPPFPTSEIMKKLPRRKMSLMQRIRIIVARAGEARWNIPAAAAVPVMAIVVVAFAVLMLREPSVTVQMSYTAPQARSVAVAGNFNKWSTDSHLMTRQNNGIWTIAIPLKPGTYTYQFVVDGRTWTVDLRAGLMQDDGFGSKNAIVRVSI